MLGRKVGLPFRAGGAGGLGRDSGFVTGPGFLILIDARHFKYGLPLLLR
jgi:hypothetical protein